LAGKSGRSTARFAVGSREGPRSNVWVLFTSKRHNDVYISIRSFADVVKVSLHESGSWRWAFTREHLSTSSPVIPPGANRTVDMWQRPSEIAPGCIQAFQVWVPSSEVTMPENPEAKPDRYQKKIHWVPRAPEGYSTCFTVVFSGPEVVPLSWDAKAGKHTYPARPIWHAELPKHGQKVWVLAHEQPMSEIERKGIEMCRQLCHQFFKHEVGTIYTALEDRRTFVYTADAEGKRCFIDIAMPN
jgi:hypothetical protein